MKHTFASMYIYDIACNGYVMPGERRLTYVEALRLLKKINKDDKFVYTMVKAK